jgi:tetratricopeptide (TPR) repeat protein
VRDEFRQSVKNTLANRVAHRCSNPECQAVTSGPATAPDLSVNVGVAAHITAASPGGARYDATLTSEERAGASNGIWTCQTCGKLIDSDAVGYPVELLRRWKADAEDRAERMLRAGIGSLSERLDLAIPSLDSDASLLSYANTSVNQIGRTDELSELTAFLGDDRPFSWWLWTGPAGVGKSRLAVELCRTVSGTWHAGFLREGHQTRLNDLQTVVPTLVVVDYAAQRSVWLSDALFQLTQHNVGAPVRVLVLEREAAGPWWDTVQRNHRSEEASYVAAAGYALPRALTGLGRDDLLKLVSSVATHLGSSLSRTEIEDVADHAHRIDPSGTPLFAFVATMDSLTDDLTGGRDDALRRLITREDSQMVSRIVSPASVSQARNVRSLATMVGGLRVDDYASFLDAPGPPVGLLPGAYDDLGGVPLDEFLDGLRPDILGELFVLDQLAATGSNRLIARTLLALAWRASPDAYKAFVERAAGDHGEHESLVDLLDVDDAAASTPAWATLVADTIPLMRRSDHPVISWILARLTTLRDSTPDRNLDEVITTARFRFANILLREDDPRRANELFTELLVASDTSWSVHADILNNRGITWSELHRKDLAIADFSSVIDASAASDEARACALNNRADILDVDDPDAGVADRAAVLALHETTYNRRFIALIRRARALWAMGDHSGAYGDVAEIIATDDIAVEQKMAARLQRAEWSVETGAPRDALPDLDVVVASHRNFEAVEARARVLLADRRVAGSGAVAGESVTESTRM